MPFQAYSDQAPFQQSGSQPQGGGNPVSGVSNFLRGIGLGLVPDTLGAGYGLTAGGGANEMFKQASGTETPNDAAAFLKASANNPFTSPEYLSKNYGDVGSAVRSGAQNELGAASWAMPVAKTGAVAKALPWLGKLAGPAESVGRNAIAGALFGASRPKASPESVGGSAALSGLLGPLAGKLGEAGTGAVNFLGKKVPTAINTALENSGSSLVRKVQEYLVGHANVDNALGAGVIPESGEVTTNVIRNSLAKAKAWQQKIEDELNSKMTGQTFKMSDVEPTIRKIAREETQGRGLNVTGYLNQIENQIPKAPIGPGIQPDPAESELPLTVLHDLKKTVNQGFDKSATQQKLSNYLRTFIEDHSGNANGINDLNKQARSAMDSVDNLQKALEARDLPEGLTPEGISKAGSNAPLPPELKTLLTTLALGLPTVAGAVKGGLTGGATGLGIGGLGSYFGLRRLFESLEQQPEAQKALASGLESIFGPIASTANTLAPAGILEKTLPRLNWNRVMKGKK